jgi:hypothetical protein
MPIIVSVALQHRFLSYPVYILRTSSLSNFANLMFYRRQEDPHLLSAPKIATQTERRFHHQFNTPPIKKQEEKQK